MQTQTKYRIVGVIVILSILAIIVPIFFEPPSDVPLPLRGDKLPKNPHEDLFNSVEFDPRDYAKPSANMPLTDPPSKEAVIAEATPAEGDTRRAEAVALPSPDEEKDHEDGDTVRAPTTWWVQMGVFAQEVNANALRDKLRAGKYSTHIDAKATPDGQRWRVMVGPEISREQAAKNRDKLARETTLHGVLVMRE